jgi:hypothetical protein
MVRSCRDSASMFAELRVMLVAVADAIRPLARNSFRPANTFLTASSWGPHVTGRSFAPRRMRRFLLTLIVGAVTLGAATSASAAIVTSAATVGGQSVQTFHGNGRAVLAKRGSILAVVAAGRIRVTDLPGGRRPARSCNKNGRRVTAVTVVYRGRDVRCRVWGVGPWRVTFLGRAISVSGIVAGHLTLDAYDSGPTGKYKIGSRPTRYWPRAPRTFRLGT